MASITVIILTYNEELHIARSVGSAKYFAEDIVIVDSFSTDKTVEIAESLGVRVLKNTFVNYSTQFQWAIDNAGIKTDWIMRLDADEIIEPDLAETITKKLPKLPNTVVGINLNRKHIFLGRWIKHGGRYPLTLLRIWRTHHGRIENRWMDEHIVVWGGSTVLFDGGFSDCNLNNLNFFTDKHNRYATREAIDVIGEKLNLFDHSDSGISSSSTSLQTAFKRFVKLNLYNKLPFGFSSALYFLFRYLFQLGFLDGKPGLVYHFLQGFWYRFLVGAKVYELELELKDLSNKVEIKERLAKLTGFDVQ